MDININELSKQPFRFPQKKPVNITESTFKIKPSNEQQVIIDEIKNGNSAMVDAVAGSGKTTTILSLAVQCSDKKILQITYNSLLKIEVRNKAKKHNIGNLEIHSYNSLAVRYYDHSAYHDRGMQQIVDKKKKLLSMPHFDVLVIDEAQDMTTLYFTFITKFLTDYCHPIQILILGDKKQGLYEFKGADIRYLTFAEKIWKQSTIMQPVKRLCLKTSFRVTNSIAHFVNKGMLNNSRIKSKKRGQPVDYIIDNPYNVYTELYNIITQELENGAKPDDFFILAYSIKSPKNPIRKLEHMLVNNGHKCFISLNDDAKLDDKDIKNKITFTTFHQAKGRERKIVIIYGFDHSYFKYDKSNKNYDICPPTIYVAATRASQRLIVTCDTFQRVPQFGFMNMNINDMINDKNINVYAKPNRYSFLQLLDDFEFDLDEMAKIGPEKTDSIKTSVTDLTKHLSEDSMMEINMLIDNLFVTRHEKGVMIDIPCKQEQNNGTCEEISDINGITIPMLYECKTQNSSTVIETLKNIRGLEEENKVFFKKYYDKVNFNDIGKMTNSDFLLTSMLYSSESDNVYFRLAQIDKYDWLTDELVKKCLDNMGKHVGKKLRYETPVKKAHMYNGNIFFSNYKYYCKYGNAEVEIAGVVDGYDKQNKVIWEFKCTESLNVDHMLQLMIYSWLWKHCGRRKGLRYLLFNIRSGEILELDSGSYLVDDMMEIIFSDKYGTKERVSNKEFTDYCEKVRKEYEKLINDSPNIDEEIKKLMDEMENYVKRLDLWRKYEEENKDNEKKLSQNKFYKKLIKERGDPQKISGTWYYPK